MARTKTYIAGEWDGDNDAIKQLYRWNEGNKWSLHFVDAHANRQCYDTSMPCTIKNSLCDRMNHSKVFILVVGNNTASARKGSCMYHISCPNKYYAGGLYACSVAGKTYSTQSFIDYECQLAYQAYTRGEMKIVVLYNAASVDKSKCPELLRGIGFHREMKSYKCNYGRYVFDYLKVRDSIEC